MRVLKVERRKQKDNDSDIKVLVTVEWSMCQDSLKPEASDAKLLELFYYAIKSTSSKKS